MDAPAPETESNNNVDLHEDVKHYGILQINISRTFM